MSETATKPEPYLAPKELSDALERQFGLKYTQRACQKLVHAMRADGMTVVRRSQVKASDAARWLGEHDGWEPFKGMYSRWGSGGLCVGR